ncbi:recombinase family protein [Nocardia asteroides]|nr:recombinase family protein [Nocardia asteroides]
MAVERTFTDKASGKDTARPQLEELIAFVRGGDTVIVHSMDHLACNLDDLRRLVRTLTGKGVRVEFVKEALTFTGEDSPMVNLVLSVMGAFAEFERALILERQREGIAAAKACGAYTDANPPSPPSKPPNCAPARPPGVSKAELVREFGVSREIVYSYLRTDAAAS